MEEIKRLELKDAMRIDSRGWSIDPFRTAGQPAENVCGLHVVSITPGVSRGNHAHRGATEWLLVFGGSAKLISRQGETSLTHEMDVSGDGPVLFEIPPKVEHAVVNTSEHIIYIIAFYDSPEADTVPCADRFEGS